MDIKSKLLIHLMIFNFSIAMLACSTAIDVDLNSSGSDRSGELDYKIGQEVSGSGMESVENTLLDQDLMGGETGVQLDEETQCVPSPELCDQVDNDCDQQIDEDYLNLGQECQVGVGRCTSIGRLICSSTKTNTVCSAQTNQTQEEQCDNIDNDCDGMIDEQVSGCCNNGTSQVCGTNTGSCMQGNQLCQNGEWGSCNGVGPSSETCDGQNDEGPQGENLCIELCDGQDNDLDGEIDEGALNACGSCGPVPLETCNQSDDDCDGVIDETTNLNNDPLNCGQCGRRCQGGSDRCFNGRCVCGSSLLTCRPNESCNGQSCCRDGICFEIP